MSLIMEVQIAFLHWTGVLHLFHHIAILDQSTLLIQIVSLRPIGPLT